MIAREGKLGFMMFCFPKFQFGSFIVVYDVFMGTLDDVPWRDSLQEIDLHVKIT